MTTAILIIAHTPLAHALRDCVLHVYPEAYNDVLAVDVLPHESPEVTIETVRRVLDNTPHSATLILTDMFGATPCNVAQKMLDGIHTRLKRVRICLCYCVLSIIAMNPWMYSLRVP